MTGNHEQQVEPVRMLSLMGFTLAHESGQVARGIELCLKAIARNPENSDHYYHLGRIYLMAGNREQAIRVFRRGLKVRRDERIMDELRRLGVRKPPPFPSLSRSHPLNRMTGKLLHSLKLR